MLQFYEQNWASEGYDSAEEEANYKAYGREILTKFWEIHHRDFQMPLAVERLFNIDIGGVKLRGYIDRVDKLESGGLSIVDYKTSQELFTVDDIEKDLQLTLYQIAAEHLWQLPVEKLTLYHMRSNTPISCAGRDEERLEEAKQLVLEVAEKIAGQVFPATENERCPCDFPEHCPYYRHQYIETTEPAAPEAVTASDIERYAALQSQIKSLQEELDELREKIIRYCEEEGLNRLFGPENEVTYKLVEMTGFDEEEVRAILEPEGLWDRVLGLDQSRLKELLADESIPGELKQQLQALRKVISTSRRLLVRRRQEDNGAA